jgi:hypothetical protein
MQRWRATAGRQVLINQVSKNGAAGWKTRNSTSEIRKKSEIRNPNAANEHFQCSAGWKAALRQGQRLFIAFEERVINPFQLASHPRGDFL